MANNFGILQSSVISTGTAKKTLLQLIAATGSKVKIKEVDISFNGTSNTAEPILVQLIRQWDAGTMTSKSPVKCDNYGDAGTEDDFLTTGGEDASVEPTDDRVLLSEHVHPQGGWSWQPPFPAELFVNGAGYLGLAVTAPNSVDAVARFVFEE